MPNTQRGGFARNIVIAELIRTFAQRGDLAHLALFRWATSASAIATFALKKYARRAGMGAR